MSLDLEIDAEAAVASQPNLGGKISQMSLRDWKSCWEADEDDIDEFTEEEIANEPAKRILWAAENGKLEIVNELLESNPELVNSCDSDSYTPLHRAAYNNHEDVAKVLLSHGANVQAKTEDGWQPLHSAARWNSVEMAHLLIHNGADVNAQTNGNLTPLHMAASNPETDQMILLLLSNPFIDVSLMSSLGETAQELCERVSPFGYLFEMLSDDINNLADRNKR